MSMRSWLGVALVIDVVGCFALAIGLVLSNGHRLGPQLAILLVALVALPFIVRHLRTAETPSP